MSKKGYDFYKEEPREFLNCVMQEDKKREQIMGNRFACELAVVDKALGLQFQGFQTFRESEKEFSFPVQQLLTRLFNHQLAVRKLLLMGYITEAASILARSMETIWLVRYFDCYPNEVDRWWGEDRGRIIRPDELRKKLKHASKEGKLRIGDVDNENKLYAALCEIGHPNYVGSVQHVHLKNVSPPQIEFSLGGYGSLERAGWLEKAFKWLLHIQMCSLITMAAVSKEFLGNNKAWMQDYSSVLEDLGNALK